MNVDEDELVKIVTCDNVEYSVKRKIVEMSSTLKDLMENLNDKSAIPVENINGSVFAKVLECMTYFHEHPVAAVADPALGEEKETKEEPDFCQGDRDMILQVLDASNYLNVKPVVDWSARQVVAMLKKLKTVQEMRDYFGIENDLTPEEEAQYEKENKWCEDR